MMPWRRRSTRPAPSAAEKKSALRENLESVLWAVTIAVVLRTFIIAPFKIPSGSMRPTLMEGDRILVSKILYRMREPQRGEIMVFRSPENPKRPFIKRLIAVGEDRVEIRGGRIVIGGRTVDLPVVRDTYYYNQGAFGQEGDVIDVPAQSFYVLGDNSASSQDSRFWGFVPRQLVIGRAVCIFWPPWRIRKLH